NQPAEYVSHIRHVFDQAREPMVPRSRDEIMAFFDGFELVEPGLVRASDWRPDDTAADDESPTGFILGGVAQRL
ncbi:MAG: SAM-dependent methyltransferase, partial [Jiangellaceae bacterium]